MAFAQPLVDTESPELRFKLICSALTGLLADHVDHPDERKGTETCRQAVARLAIEHADAVLERLRQE